LLIEFFSFSRGVKVTWYCSKPNFEEVSLGVTIIEFCVGENRRRCL
jgi:hypothetical protein